MHSIYVSGKNNFLILITLLFSFMGFNNPISAQQTSFPIDTEYSLKLNDREAGFYYSEKLTEAEDVYTLEMSMAIHDEQTNGRYGCEQTNRLIIQQILKSGVLGEEGLGNEDMSEEEFAKFYKDVFIQFASNIRPYKDLAGFYESLEIWYIQNCIFRNRLESQPEWYLNLPFETLSLNADGSPKIKTVATTQIVQRKGTVHHVSYGENEIQFTVETDEFPEVRASKTLEQKVYDPFQLNMIVSSFDYHEGFEYDVRFKNIYVDFPLGDDEPVSESFDSEIYPIDVKINVHGTMFLPVDGVEIEVWAVDVSGFKDLYHPLLDLYDSYHRTFTNLIRYYIAKETGKIMMMETLTSSGRPVSVYHATY